MRHGRAAVLGSLLLLGTTWIGCGDDPEPAAVQGSTETAGAVEVSKKPERQVYGYAYKTELMSAAMKKDVERGLLTAVAVSFAYVDSGGNLTNFDPQSATLKQFVEFAHAKGVSVHLAVALLQTDPRPDVKRDAALALGETAGESALPQLRLQAKEDGIAGVYAMMALEGMRKKAAILVSCEVQGEWRERLERMLEDNRESVAMEALGALAFLSESTTPAVLGALLRRPSASESAKKRALLLLGRVGTPEDVGELSVAPSLEADRVSARAVILSRERGCDDSRGENE